MSRPGVVGLAVVGVLLLATPSDAAVLCRGRGGKLVLREKCRKAEQMLDPSQLDLSALAGSQGGPGGVGPRGQHPLKIVDSAGVELGSIESFSGGAGVVAITHPALTETVLFALGPDGFSHNMGGAISTVSYAAADCAGVPYVRPYGSALRIAQVYGNAAYYDTGPSESRGMMSSEYDAGGTPCTGGSAATTRGTCCGNAAFTEIAAPAIRVPLADLGFVPPFRAVPR